MKYILYELISNDFDAFLSDRVGSLQVEMSGPKVGKAPGSECWSCGRSLFIHPGVKVMFSKMSVMCLVMIWVECSAYNMI